MTDKEWRALPYKLMVVEGHFKGDFWRFESILAADEFINLCRKEGVGSLVPKGKMAIKQGRKIVERR